VADAVSEANIAMLERADVATACSMIQATFGDAVRSKSDSGRHNEVLCKVLCHKVCVLIQAMHELGIEPTGESARLTGATRACS